MPQGNASGGLPNRGSTYHGGTPTSIGRSVDLEGTEVEFQDLIPQSNGPDLKRSGRTVLCRLVRNVSGITLEAKRVVSWEAANRGTRVDGYTSVTNGEPAGVVDDHLNSNGVANNDLFWIVRQGPCNCLTDIASGASTVVAQGALVGALTAASSQATTAGRITDVTATTGDTVTNVLGRAMSAATTANTNSDVLVDMFLVP